MDMADICNSQLLISQESVQGTEIGSTPLGETQSTPQGEAESTPQGEAESTPHGETADNLEAVTHSRLKSVVWDHFNKTKVNGEDKAQCKYCKKYLGGKSKNGTKHLHQHMNVCPQRKIFMRGKNSKGQTFLMPKTLHGKNELCNGNYDAENARKELANAIIMHEYPLSIVDHIGFKRYSSALQPLFQVPSRNTIKKEIFKVYDSERSMTLKLLDSLEGRVAITSDMWTAGNQKRGYMAVTAHYIDASWTLTSHILRFIYIPAPYTSDRLANAFKYPTLQLIAKDLLAIPVSIVASESAFSTSGNILSPHRSRLHWTTLEALMCSRSWLWSAQNACSSNSKVGNDFATFLNEIESDDEGDLVSGVISLVEEDR